MQINISSETEKAIRRRVAEGKFQSPEEVIQAALLQLEEYENSVEEIQLSLADEQAGRVLDIEKVDQLLRQKYGFEKNQ